MQKSDSIAEIAAAMAKAQACLRPAKKDSVNPHYKSRYADLASVMEACRDALAANDLSVVQAPLDTMPGYASLETMILHKSGEWLATTASCKLSRDDAQGYGSALTYLRRYCLAAMLGIAQDDDDGETASRRSDETPKTQRQSPPNHARELADLSVRLKTLKDIEKECIGSAPKAKKLPDGARDEQKLHALREEIAASRNRIAAFADLSNSADVSDDELREHAIAKAAMVDKIVPDDL